MYMVVLSSPYQDQGDWQIDGAEETPDGCRVYFSSLVVARAFARRFHSKVQKAEWRIDLSYQDAWQPMPLGRRLWLIPETKEGEAPHQPPPGRIPLIMKQGLVFGAGDHESTRGCLELLEALPLSGKSVFDLGCGTGILAEAALLLGADHVLACDLDADACQMTHQRGISTFHGPSQALRSQSFHLILANIPGFAHLDLIPEYQRLLLPGGHLILSGYYETQAQRLEAALTAFTKLAQRPSVDGWVAATFSNTSQA